MRITNNMVTGSIIAELQQLETTQATIQAKLSSGLAVSQPSDDPQAFGQVIQLQSQSRQLQQYGKNADQATNLANASYAGLSSLQQLYDRASQLGALGTGATDPSSQQNYATEVDQLIQQTVQVANTQLQGNYLFAGTAVGTPPFVATNNAQGQIASVAYAGNSNATKIPISQNSAISPTTSGATNSGIADFINNLVSLRDALQSGDPTAMGSANAALASSENVITSAVADNGAVQARIQSDQTEQQATALQNTTMISSATDLDLPSAEIQLTQAQTAYQAALQSASSIMHLSILNYITLQ